MAPVHAGFHVLGAGSVGLLFAHHLRQATHPVTLLFRDMRAVERLRSCGGTVTLERSFRGKREVLATDAAAEPVHAAPGTEPQGEIGALVVATKSADVVRAVRGVAHRLTPASHLVLLQNGVLAVYQELWREVLAPLVPSGRAPRVIIGSNTHGAYLAAHPPFTVVHAGEGACTFAEVDASLPCLTDPGHARMWQQEPSPVLRALLALSELHATAAPSHELLTRQLHTKLAVNCAINPLTALLGCLNGNLIAHSHTRDIMRSVCAELFALYGPQLSQSTDELYDTVFKVAQATAQNKSSMFQDIRNARITEVEYLSGYVCSQARSMQVAVPVNETLYNAIKAKERMAADSAHATRS
eukprot:CAMPEP_0202860324 /NCGR_PEP_ID=MMETSP1391-20130828/2080_1 /ASSEMBLY_ACC=CAM_ASM_000867 /TAXON_ID=1034604 /ORGANISM="Chlamydomonas leiostraca, Strain SAG 11-49" /LENGTH=355 /DNA_ID=CAMNT_0049539479 /DNA_START=199 /DNA_END=1266 /DNA_ORIENTATION=+